MKKICIWFLLCIATLKISAQQVFSVSGTVYDKQAALPGATVFLTGTKFITAADNQGNFKFKGVVAGNYQAVVKMLGFQPLIKPVTVSNTDVNINFSLKVSVSPLNEVKVRPDKEWFKNLEMFKAQFLGETEFAKKCRILNAERLSLQYDKKKHKLKAGSDDLLQIENRSLGYKITYLLSAFEYDKDLNMVVFQGYPSFENLKGTNREEVVWKMNRKRAYDGSLQHFMRAAYNNNLTQQGYLVYGLHNWLPGGQRADQNMPISLDTVEAPIKSFISSAGKVAKKFVFNDALMVIYTRQYEPDIYEGKGYSLRQVFKSINLPAGQVSIVNQLNQNGVQIDPRGSFTDIPNLYFEGYIGWLKIADLNPFGYLPAE